MERGKSRDYYDVWRLLKEKATLINFKLLGKVLVKKLEHKNLKVAEISDFLPKDIDTLKRYWASELEPQITQLPSLDIVLPELQGMLKEYVLPYLILAKND